MLKVELLFLIGVMLIIEGYFNLIRGILPVSASQTFSDENIYMKVVIVEEGFDSNLLFYILGAILIALAIILRRRINVGNRNI
ncbi:hypothetical protein [Paraglaciecola sp.]|uniref:hypothetical protein n=1 Tax=Paraglaciecola sp. TaxID=1920173 RepID=UPI0030F3CC07